MFGKNKNRIPGPGFSAFHPPRSTEDGGMENEWQMRLQHRVRRFLISDRPAIPY